MRPKLITLSFLAPLLFWESLYAQTGQPHLDPQAVTSVQKLPLSSIQTALIAAVGALLGVVLKDLIFKVLDERRANKSAMNAVYSRYSGPLSSSTSSLMLRLHEIIEKPGRGRFLKLVGTPIVTNKYSTYGAYKKLSTLYRLAVLLGWIRACRREFSYLKVAAPGLLAPVEAAISDFEHALADGPAVEVERLVGLCKLWGIDAPKDENLCSSVAVDLEAAIDDYMADSNIDELVMLSNEQKSVVAAVAAKVITSKLSLKDIPQGVLKQTCEQAVQIIDIKEAWIYRDWQSAIGDLMLNTIDGSERRFEVIGFSQFESMCSTGTDEQKKWITRISSVFDGIDLARKDPYDHRPRQLTTVLRATASLILAISMCVDDTHLSATVLELAKQVTERRSN